MTEETKDEAKEEKQIYFATIGAVFEDGVSLIFDEQEDKTPTEKHYRCNTSVFFHPGDRVKILPDSGTYVVEYVVGSPQQKAPDSGKVPTGGGPGAVLRKSSKADFDMVWELLKGLLPAGGKIKQILRKKSEKDFEVEWVDAESKLPSGGTKGQILTKTSNMDNEAGWANAPKELPNGGSAGQYLKKTSSGTEWGDGPNGLPTGGSSGQTIVRTGYGSGTPTWVAYIPAGGNDGQVLKKKGRGNYEMEWGYSPLPSAILNQYNGDPRYAIQFRTDTTYGSNPKFYVRCGSSGTWKQINLV